MLIIGIAGGTGSGKTTVVNRIIQSLPPGEVAILPQDAYYKLRLFLLNCYRNITPAISPRLSAAKSTSTSQQP